MLKSESWFLQLQERIGLPVVVGFLSELQIKERMNVSTLQMVAFPQKLCCSSTRIHGVISKKNPSLIF